MTLRRFSSLRSLATLTVAALGTFAACSSDDGGCTKDTDCKGDRVCSANGECVEGSASTSGGGDATSTTASGSGGAAAGSGGNGSAVATGSSSGSGMMCEAGKTSCDGVCVDTASDPNHCGACGAVCSFDATCKAGKCEPLPCHALSFDGMNDVVTVPASADFAYGNEFTVEVWMRSVPSVDYPRILSHEATPNSGNSLYTSWEIDGVNKLGQVRFGTANSGNAQAVTTLVKANTWAHFATVVTNGKDLQIFVDGKKSGTGTGSFTGDTTKVGLGIGAQLKYLTDYPYGGSLGPIRLSKKARYAADFKPTWGWAPDADTIAVWNMFEGSGTKLVDGTAGKHDGVLNGPVWEAVACPSSPSAPAWKAMGTKTAAVMTGSCAGSKTTTVKCDATTKGVEARVLDVKGVELKPLADLQETGAVQGRTATLSADAVTLTLAGEVGCGADKLVNATVTTYVCE